MTSSKPVFWTAASPSGRAWSHPVRRVAAASLQAASASLARLAVQLSPPAASVAAADPGTVRLPPMFEFHAEAGAPEGALYVDGQFVGWLPGVRRL